MMTILKRATNISPSRPCLAVMVFLCAGGVTLGPTESTATAQDVVVAVPEYRYPRRIRWGVYDPYYAITARVYAQADMIRAQGDAAVSFADARNLHADAYSKELDNWIKELRVYWDRKTLAEQKKLELANVRQIGRMRYLNDQKWQNSRFWDRLKNHPELSETRIKNGDALNFLLARLSTSSLPYKFDAATSRYGPDAIDELGLDEQTLANITLKQGPFQFPADKSIDGTISLWPYVLRWDEFEPARTEFERTRLAVVEDSESGKQVSVNRIQAMHHALVQLTNEFHRSDKVKHWVKEHNRYRHFYASDKFLEELDREIVRLEQTGDIRPLRGQSGYDPKVDGKHAVSLLCFMNRNGIEFGKAKPGSEFAYHRLFVLMRSLYLTLAEDDDSVHPQQLDGR